MVSRKSHFLLFALLGLAITASPRIVPSIDLPSIVLRADLVVVGQAISIEPGSNGPTVSARVTRVLKGKHAQPQVSFRSSPLEITGVTGPVTLSRFGIFFLRESPSGSLEVVDRHYPVLPAEPTGAVIGASPFDRVVNELTQLLKVDRKSGSDSQFRLATYLLKNVNHPFVIERMQSAAQRDDSIGTLALSQLLLRGDVSQLSKAERVLTSRGSLNKQDAAMLGASLAGIKDPKAVPILSVLVVRGSVATRRGAAIALGNTFDRIAVPALGRALEDADWEVRYNTVVALEKIERQSHWAMALEYFEKEEKRLLAHWRKRVRELTQS